MDVVALEQLERAIDALAATTPDVPDAELDECVIRLRRSIQRLGGVAAPWLSRWDDRTVWTGDGSLSAATRLARDAHESITTSRTALRRARFLRDWPTIADAVRDGRLSLDHADLLANAHRPERHDLFTRDLTTLVGILTRLRWIPAIRALRYWAQRADAELAATGVPTDHTPRSHLHASRTFHGRTRLDGDLDPIGGTIVLAELDRLTDQIRASDHATGTDRTPAERRALALIEMARRSASATTTGRARPLFTVVVGDQRFADLCELADGTVIAPDQLVPHLTDADIETMLFSGTTLVATSRRRTFTGRLRRAIAARDRHCQHPSGCDVPADRCDVDHIQPAAHGGPTSQDNGRLECRPHNRDRTKHDHGARRLTTLPIDHLERRRIAIAWQLRQEARRHPPDDDPDDEPLD